MKKLLIIFLITSVTFGTLTIERVESKPPLHLLVRNGTLSGFVDIAANDPCRVGVISFEDWTTFNNKEDAITAGDANQIWKGNKTWGYLDSNDISGIETDPCWTNYLALHPYNDANWNTAYGWGNHASAGYYKSGDSPTFANITDSGYLSLGTGVGAAATPINIDYDIDSGNLTGLNLNLTNTRVAALGNTKGLSFTAEWKPADALTANRNSTGIYGIFGVAKIDSTNITSAYNVTTSNLVGIYAQIQATKGASHGGAVTVTAGKGLYILDAALAGTTPTITTLTGLYLDTMTKGGTNWQIYSTGGNSAFGGNTSFGKETTPAASVDGTTGLFSSTLGVTGITTTGGITSTADINSVSYSANGIAGISTIVYTVDGNSTLHTLTFTKGLLTGVTP